jgi:Na+-transporting NADH:ubiquinone oxidoreductase subunit NqrE
VSAARAVLGVALVGAAILGVVVSLRYLVHAYLLRDRRLAVVAALDLVVFAFAVLLLVVGGVL